MNVIVHYPKRSEDIQTLQKRIAMIHAQAVISYIQKLSCPKEQKLHLLNKIEKSQGQPENYKNLTL
ncbi:MAG: hypothetical protein FIA99_02970 [Ruminiclostridium sp.]|nr:hypothetical protein [Ruminiclostridium sp.]